jgi:hypothetical protein
MPVRASFVADFASFHAAVQRAEVELKSFESGAGKVGTALNRMVDQFSGRKLIQDATLMAEAIERIGGPAKLTANELARVAEKAGEATAKMRAMGMEVPASLQKITDQTKLLTTLQGDMASMVTRVGGAFGIAFGLGAVVNFTRAIINTADELTRLQAKTGISAQGLQRFQVVADDAGNTVTELADAVTQMQNRLAGNDRSALNALRQLNISLSDLRGLRPDDQFMLIADALREMEDPAGQVTTAIDLFGRTGANVLPSIKRGFDDVKDASVGMSDAAVEALDRAGDAYTRFKRDVTAAAGETISWTIRMQKAYDDFLERRFGLSDRPVNETVPQMLDPATFAELHRPLAQIADAFAATTLNVEEEAAAIRALQNEYEVLAAKNRIVAEAARALDAVQETMWRRSLELAKQMQAELEKTSAGYLKVTNAAVIANINAREQINARQGFDVQGQPLTTGNDARSVYERKLRDLNANAPAGIDISAQQELLFLEFIDSFNKATEAANTLTEAHVAVASGAEALRSASDAAIGPLLALGPAATQAGSQMLGIATFMRDFKEIGEPGFSGWRPGGASPFMGTLPRTLPMTLDFAKGKADTGQWTVNVNANGMMLTSDPQARAEFASMVEEILMSKLRQSGMKFGTA